MNANTFDLQIQSSASDGKHSPTAIIAMARERGVAIIALTDHDTTDGVVEAQSAAGRDASVRVIAGIELSVEEHGLHILGYGIEINNNALQNALAIARKERLLGAQQMVENLQRAGFVVEWDDVLRQAQGSVVARPHLARAALSRVENKEKLKDIATAHDFITRYLSDASPSYVHRAHIAARDAIALIRGAGGVAVWSHPAIHFADQHEECAKMLEQLITWGLEGIEVFNPSHTEDDVEYLASLALRFSLLQTAGSDFHEQGEHPTHANGLHAARHVGDYETYGFSVVDIIPQLDNAMKARRVAS